MAEVLFVVTSHAQLGATGKATGLWLEELAAPWYAVQDAGHLPTLASPQGGRVPVDPGSDQPGQARPTSVERFLNDPEAMYMLDNARPLADMRWQEFEAFFLPGGHGVMWDLPDDTRLAQMLGAAADDGRIIAAVCHGPAGLVNVRRLDGAPLVAGRRVACFTDSEEAAVGLTDTVPFLLASKLASLGAVLSAGPDFQPHAVRDANLITGQNPASSEAAARLLVTALAEQATTLDQ